MHPPLVSSSFFLIDCHNSQYRYSKFFRMFHCCCSPPCFLRLLFSGSAVLWLPKTPVTARDLGAEDLGSVSAWFRELAGNGCLPFPALAIIGAPHLSMACLPKLIGFLSKWWLSKSVKIWSPDRHGKVKMRGREEWRNMLLTTFLYPQLLETLILLINSGYKNVFSSIQNYFAVVSFQHKFYTTKIRKSPCFVFKSVTKKELHLQVLKYHRSVM